MGNDDARMGDRCDLSRESEQKRPLIGQIQQSCSVSNPYLVPDEGEYQSNRCVRQKEGTGTVDPPKAAGHSCLTLSPPGNYYSH